MDRTLYNLKQRKVKAFLFKSFVWFCGILTVGILIYILLFILLKGVPKINLKFLFGEYNSETLSVFSSMVTTVQMIVLSLLISVPIGVFCAIYLAEYAKRGNKAVKVIRLAIDTLAGIPSIVYGLFGMIFFVQILGFRASVLSGICTISIMILPVIISSSEEAIKSVPDTYREGSLGLGATRLRTVFRIVLPTAMPGILAGIILAIGRIVGETAALIFTSGTNVLKNPSLNLMASQRTLAIHMYMLASEGLPHSMVDELLSGGGMDSMMWTISLIMCALTFGGVLESTGMMACIANKMLDFAKKTGSLVLVTVLSCLFVNILCADQYLSIALPGKMFKDAYAKRGLAPRNLSRTLEDSGTVTSALVPWNTCGATMSSFLGVSTFAYAPFAFFNILSPIISIIYAFTGFSIMTIEEDPSSPEYKQKMKLKKSPKELEEFIQNYQARQA
jgi:phosphate transport system permease protein